MSNSTMPSRDRIDVTPRPAEFDAVPGPARVTGAELVVTVVAMAVLLLTVVLVQDPAVRAAGVLLVTGALSGYVARRVAADRRRRRIRGPRSPRGSTRRSTRCAVLPMEHHGFQGRRTSHR